MEKYPSNSDRSKDESNDVPEKKGPVINGKAAVKKRGFFDRLVEAVLPDGLAPIGQKIITDVVVPGIRDGIIDTVNTIFSGAPNRGTTYYSSPSGHINYSSITSPTKASTVTSVQSNVSKKTYEFENIVFDNRGDAEVVLDEMNRHMYAYDMVRVSDFYEFAGVSCDYTSQKYGWLDISNACVVRTPGGWRIQLPKAIPLD